MTRNVRLFVLAATLAGATGAPALALGPLDGDVSALWWDNEFTATEGATATSHEAAAPGFRATLWVRERYGVRAEQFSSEPDATGLESTDYASLDVMWRAFAPSDKSFVALGLGWQDMDLGSVEAGSDTSGVRLSLEGRLGLTEKIQAYGSGAYFPSLDDARSASTGGLLQDLDGYQFELGMHWRVAPAISVVGGWRFNTLDYERGILVPAVAPLADPAGTGGSALGGGSGAGSVNSHPPVPPDGGCSCEPSVVPQSGSAEADGAFVGLNIRF